LRSSRSSTASASAQRNQNSPIPALHGVFYVGEAAVAAHHAARVVAGALDWWGKGEGTVVVLAHVQL
jgi:hypothetical protein